MDDFKKVGWELAKGEGRIGTGNWDAWNLGMDPILAVARQWKEQLSGVEKPWLCWNIHDDWCRIQQNLVLEAGWTPVVGNDTNVQKPTILKGSVYVNFNEDLKLTSMWMHFPLEFVFLFCKKLAFWHSDFLCSVKDMQKFARIFEGLEDGVCASAYACDSIWPWRDKKRDKYFELLGCTTESASRSQFENGVGWWRNVQCHPNFKKAEHKEDYRYEHGVGVLVWKNKFDGKVVKLKPNEKLGHCDRKKETLKQISGKYEEMEAYYNLPNVAKRLGIENFL